MTKTGEVGRALVLQFMRERGVNDPMVTDALLAFLYENGFVVTGAKYRRPARRGTGNTKPPKYTGPDFLGKSHSAKLAGQ